MKWNKWMTGLLVIAVVGGYYWHYSRQSTMKTVQYITAPVEKGAIASSVSGSGNVIVDQSATVDPTITGTVADLAVAVGDSVKKGQVLFSIVNDQLSVDVAKASASNLQSRNAIDSALLDKQQAKANYDKAKKKDDTDPTAYTSKELAVLKQKIDIADQAIDLAQKNAAASGLSYRKTANDAAKRQVTSPIDGTVNEINIKNGDDLSKISTGNAKLSPIIIGDLKTLKASVKVNEVDILKVSLGQKATLKLTALDDLGVSGTVEKIDSLGTVSQGVVTYTVVIGFDALDDRIKPNMSISASIVSETKQDVLIVPNSALKNDTQGSYVEILVNGVSQRHDVKIGISSSADTEILNGLSAGDKVITQTIDPNAASTTGSTSGGLRIPGLGGGGASSGGARSSTGR